VQKFLLLTFLAIITCGLGSCASRPKKSESHIYNGDAPNIRYAPSKAGGPQSVY
jgi:hypothetical protein